MNLEVFVASARDFLVIVFVNFILPSLVVALLQRYASKLKLDKQVIHFTQAALLVYAIVFGLLRPVAALIVGHW